MKNNRLVITHLILTFVIVLLFACNRSTNQTDHITIEKGSFTDPRDGKIYKTVKIGDQWILAENMAYKPDTGNYWAYENDNSNIAIYGYLYDWETAMNNVPPGWHIPSGDEWLAVAKSLGCKNKDSWRYLEEIYPKLVVGGSSGLNMLLGGMRTCDGEFKCLNDKARFWTSITTIKQKDSYKSNIRVYGLESKDDDRHGLNFRKTAYMFYNGKKYPACCGFSVRLFKD
ncbi:FISUMP domain-containing protein [Mangrovibacterium diazotrophicum]|uniref:Uncharacterized protein (TIGR02145 family) n=1 Tax=Mangrovibacterium diazotrophicum TaxID=1261403 RepID=A0A419VVQ8_9BACT|nr:FISUMP domain-containing protein [Mangrovibacterium diazotrophicum]RKD86136.1 uncharacterized protein (TIGR02145 family) [Mangrovibacterium diazotrophicum]